MSDRFLRLASEPRVDPLADADAIAAARKAFAAAQAAQLNIVTSQWITRMLFEGKKVTYVRLKGMRADARRQVEHARAVEAALDDAIAAMEATRPRQETP